MNYTSLKKLNGVFVFLALFAMAFIAYWPILNYAQFHDDWLHYIRISNLPASELWRVLEFQQDISWGPAVFFRPFGWLVLWVIYQIFGISPLPAHFLNVCIHAGIGYVLFWLMTRLRITRFAAFLAATLFILSPISPGAVTWLAGRFDLLALFFLLLAMVLYLVSIQSKSRPAFAGSMVAAAVSLFSKENTMIIVVLIPALEILFVSNPYEAADSIKRRLIARLKVSGGRLGVFLALFTGFFVFRYFWLGGLGGYPGESIFTLHGIRNVPKSLLVVVAPFDRVLVSKTTTGIFAIYIILLCLVSFGIVVFQWRYASKPLRKAMIFMAIFFLISIVPVWFALLHGFNFYLMESRFYYSTTCALLVLIVVGLLEFGWDRKSWRIASSVALILLIMIYSYGLRENNRVWSFEPAISSYIADETYRLVPDPPYGTKFFYQNLPKTIGDYQFGSDIPEAIMIKYGKQMQSDFYTNPENREIQVYSFNPDLSPENYTSEARGDSSDGYLFFFDWDNKKLYLVHEPR